MKPNRLDATPREKPNIVWPLVASAAIAVLVFIFDLAMPLGIAAGVPYIGLVLAGLWYPNRRAVFVLAFVGTALVAEGYFLSEEGGIWWVVLTNRALAVAAIWITALLCYQRRLEEARKREAEHLHSSIMLEESEKRLRAIADNAPAEIILKDTQGRFLLVNKAFTDLFGKSIEDVRGKTVHDLYPKEFADSVEEHEAEILSTGRTSEQEHQVLRLDGVHILRSIKFPVRNLDGEITGTGSIITDITEHKRAEDKVRESERHLRLIADAMPGTVSFIDANHRYLFANRQFRVLYGVDPETLIGTHLRDVMGPMYDKFRDRLDEVLEGKTVSYEGIFESEGRDPWPFHATYVPHRDETGKVSGFFTLVQNISEQKNTERELMKARDEAELANRSKNEFLTSMSHELRTPLNAIIGFSETMESEIFGSMGNPKYREYASNIVESGRHLLDLINNILDISIVESGDVELKREKLNLAEVVEVVLQLVRSRAAEGHIRLFVHIDPEAPEIHADPRRLKQICLHLLSNAIKFTPSGGEVKLRVDTDDGQVRIIVTDTGIGMDAEDIQKALTPFRQVDGRLERAYEGSGLGLPLAKSFSELHGGSLEIESRKGEGTTVTVHLPLGRPAIMDEGPKAEAADGA